MPKALLLAIAAALADTACAPKPKMTESNAHRRSRPGGKRFATTTPAQGRAHAHTGAAP